MLSSSSGSDSESDAGIYPVDKAGSNGRTFGAVSGGDEENLFFFVSGSSSSEDLSFSSSSITSLSGAGASERRKDAGDTG